MDKKNRTGLQSKISHIFAGVPMPKKKGDQPEQPNIKEEDKVTEPIEPVSDGIVIEETLSEQKIEGANLEEEIFEVSLSQEELDELEQVSSQKAEPKKIEPKPLEPIQKPAQDKRSEDNLSQEKFSKISEPSSTEKKSPSDTQSEESQQNPKTSVSDRVDTLSNLLASNDSASLGKNKKSNIKPSNDSEKESEETSKVLFDKKTHNKT